MDLAITDKISQSMEGNKNAAKGRPFTDELRTHLFREGRKRMGAVVGALISKAEEGDVQAIREVADRIEGKVASQDNGASFKVLVIRDDTNRAITIEAEDVTEHEV